MGTNCEGHCAMLSQTWWKQVVKLEHLEIVRSWGLKPGVDCGVSAVEVASRNVEAVNCALTTREHGLWKVRIIFTDMFFSKKSSGVCYADEFLRHGGVCGDNLEMYLI